MKYTGRNGEYDYYELKNTIEDDFDYIGTSGAPIFDNSGQFVGLVKGGFKSTLKSVPFQNIKLLLEVENLKKNKPKENGV